MLKRNGQCYPVLKDQIHGYIYIWIYIAIVSAINLKPKQENFEEDLNSKNSKVFTFELFLILPSVAEPYKGLGQKGPLKTL